MLLRLLVSRQTGKAVRNVGRTFTGLALALCLAQAAFGADIQGVLTDWKCTERMVKDGREKTLKADNTCSLRKNSARSDYGLITDEKKFYRLDEAGVKRAKELLNNSHDKDNLRVIVHGDLDGNLLKVSVMSIL
jgi:hypothetical protein